MFGGFTMVKTDIGGNDDDSAGERPCQAEELKAALPYKLPYDQDGPKPQVAAGGQRNFAPVANGEQLQLHHIDGKKRNQPVLENKKGLEVWERRVKEASDEKSRKARQTANINDDVAQSRNNATQHQKAESGDSELNSMISQFVSPISNKIFMDYDPGLRFKKEVLKKEETAGDMHLETLLQHEMQGLKGHVYMELLVHIYQSIDFLQNLAIPEDQILEKQIEVIFKKPNTTKMLLLDLDETLVHCVKKPNPQRPPMVKIDITTPNGNVIKDVGFNIRPKCHELLESANRHYEVCVFTASTPQYADAIIDHLDPTGRLIQHRFYRTSCIKTPGGEYIKDLRVFKNIELKNILLVDNAVYSFGQQLSNGIPIASFQEDLEDQEFEFLIPFLEACAQYDDVRDYNKRTFQLQELCDTPFENWIEHYYDMEDCQRLMEEERADIAEHSQQYEQHYIPSSTGGRASTHGASVPPTKKMPPKSVDECLDGLSAILRSNGGKLPIECSDEE